MVAALAVTWTLNRVPVCRQLAYFKPHGQSRPWVPLVDTCCPPFGVDHSAEAKSAAQLVRSMVRAIGQVISVAGSPNELETTPVLGTGIASKGRTFGWRTTKADRELGEQPLRLSSQPVHVQTPWISTMLGSHQALIFRGLILQHSRSPARMSGHRWYSGLSFIDILLPGIGGRDTTVIVSTATESSDGGQEYLTTWRGLRQSCDSLKTTSKLSTPPSPEGAPEEPFPVKPSQNLRTRGFEPGGLGFGLGRPAEQSVYETRSRGEGPGELGGKTIAIWNGSACILQVPLPSL